ncbi:MAG TPA: hypothetical protein VGF40_06160 [Thermoanaerobaculia bacterium]
MLRRLSALIGIILLAAILIALVWAVHEHRTRTIDEMSEPQVRIDRDSAAGRTEGERSC